VCVSWQDVCVSLWFGKLATDGACLFFCLFLMKNVAKSSTVTVGLMKEEEEDLKDNNHATLLPIYNFIYMYFSGSCIQNPLDSNMWWA